MTSKQEKSEDKEELIFSGEIAFHKDNDGRYQTTPNVYYKHALMPTTSEYKRGDVIWKGQTRVIVAGKARLMLGKSHL